MKIRDFCFVVGRDKRSIKDHFALHQSYLNELSVNRKTMLNFYKKLKNCHLIWVNQNKPLGFGDAVKRVEKFVGEEDFILHAGDVSIVSRFKHPVLRLIETAKKNPDASAILVCKKVKDAKRYGILQIKNRSSQVYSLKELKRNLLNPNLILVFWHYTILNQKFFIVLKKLNEEKIMSYN